MKYKIVKIKKIKEEYKKLGLSKDSLGLLLNEKNSQCLIIFFNNVNQGDYLVHVMGETDLIITDMVLHSNLCAELEEHIENNADKISNKTNFKAIPFNECDEVELMTVQKACSIEFSGHATEKARKPNGLRAYRLFFTDEVHRLSPGENQAKVLMLFLGHFCTQSLQPAHLE